MQPNDGLEVVTPDGVHAPPAAPRGRAIRSTIVATGAAFGLTLAGLGIASAQVPSGAGPTPAQSITLAQATAEPDATPTSPDAGRPGRGRGRHGGPRLAVAASTIGVSEDELRTAIREGRTIAEVAQSKDVEPQRVIDALVADGKERLAAAVAAGHMTQEHADEHAALLDDHMARFVNETRPAHGPGRRGGPDGGAMKAGLSVAASSIGITEAELVAALRGGESIAQVARSRDVDPQKVIEALVADAERRLAEKVEAGALTQEQADTRAAMLEERITALVNREGGFGRARHGRPGGGPDTDAGAEPAGATA